MQKDFKQNISWKDNLTKNKYNARILFSVINKELRRGNLENSLAVGKELFESGEKFQDKLWQRLITVAAEDVGLGNIGLYLYVCESYELFFLQRDYKYIGMCITQICKSPKSRFADEVLNYCLLKYVATNKEYFSKRTKTGVLNNAKLDALSTALKEKDLIEAVGTFISFAFSGKVNEDKAWHELQNILPEWEEYLTVAHIMSQKMKPGKNDRVMAGVLFITAFIMGLKIIPVKASDSFTEFKKQKPIKIPEYALDLHANISGKRLTTEDFREFWLEGSKLNNEVDFSANKYHTYKYKDYILKNLDTFLDLYNYRKTIVFDYKD